MITVLKTSKITLYSKGNSDRLVSCETDNYVEKLNLLKRSPNIIVGWYTHASSDAADFINHALDNHENAVFIDTAIWKTHVYLPKMFEVKFSEEELKFLIRKIEALLTVNDIINHTGIQNYEIDIVTDNLALMTYTIEERKDVIQNIFVPMRNMFEDGLYADVLKTDIDRRFKNIFD